MKPWITVAMAPGGLVLQERDGVYVIRVDGRELMSSARHGSEEEMASAGLGRLEGERPTVLIGGLGLGYTLRAALDRLPSKARVVVAEISAEVVAWNRGPLVKLARAPLLDPRVSVEVADIAHLVESSPDRFDAILLDVDNGPKALSRSGNQRLYGRAGLSAFLKALRPEGVLVVWSAGPAPGFLEALRRAGFEAGEQKVAARARAGGRHTLFLARAPASHRRPAKLAPAAGGGPSARE